jgi:hypothetical protein
MSSEPMLFDPEVETILREVASDPRSSLLKVPRPAHLKGLFERYTNVGPQTAGFTTLERHLLQVHRSEVARLLADVCRRRLAVGNPTINRSLTVDTEVRIYEERELQDRARSMQAADVEPRDPDVEDLLARCVSGELSREPTVAELATAMARLEPNDTARVLAGLDLTMRGSPRAALELYRNVLNGAPSPLMESITWDNIGRAQSLLGAGDLALASYRRSATCGLPRSAPALVWFWLAVTRMQHSEAIRAGTLLNELVLPEHGSIEWYRSSLILRRDSGFWSSTPEMQALARRVTDELGGAAGRLVDVWA